MSTIQAGQASGSEGTTGNGALSHTKESPSRSRSHISRNRSFGNLSETGSDLHRHGKGSGKQKTFVAHTSGTRHHHRALSSGHRVPSYGRNLNKLTTLTDLHKTNTDHQNISNNTQATSNSSQSNIEITHASSSASSSPSSISSSIPTNLSTTPVTTPALSTAGFGVAHSTHVSRTQQKLMLQRQLTSDMTFGDEPNLAALSLNDNNKLHRELERISREYLNAVRFEDPLLAEILLLEKSGAFKDGENE